MAVALIVAAGRGERLGSGRPKALVPLYGRPMLEWSVAALRAVPAVQQIVVALPAAALDAAPAGVIAVAGGDQRSHSVRAALAASGGGDPVIVHDAARPLAETELFEQALEELERSQADAVIAAAPVSDTIKECAEDGRTVARTLDRSRLWAIQTPQVFRRAALERALSGTDAELARATDDAWLVEQAGGAVRILGSGPGNLKVTTPEDLRVAELLLRDRLGEARPGSERLADGETSRWGRLR
jgi:2-C-methyl-D-erythritol 4-phosphate cytidylyltransferase